MDKNGVCAINPKGVHDYNTGNTCVFCGNTRAQAEETKTAEPIPSPFLDKLFARHEVEDMIDRQFGSEQDQIHALHQKDAIIIDNHAANPEEALKHLQEKGVPDALMSEILRATKSKAALIITFDEPVASPTVKGFHISSANIHFKAFAPLMDFLSKALLGRIGGKLNLHQKEPPENGN